MISQLTVFLENEEGRLASAVRTISNAGINMQALFLADTADFGILRIFCDTPKKACAALIDAGYRAKLIDVVAVKVSNKPGELANLMDYLNDTNVNVEYAHCFIVGEYAYDVRYWRQLPERIAAVAERLKDAQIEQSPAVDVIRRFRHPDVLIYADPPYMLHTRKGKQYIVEMAEEAQHIELLDALKEHPGPVILSGYDNVVPHGGWKA